MNSKTSFEALETSFKALESDFETGFHKKKSAEDGDPVGDGDPVDHPLAIGVADELPRGLGVSGAWGG